MSTLSHYIQIIFHVSTYNMTKIFHKRHLFNTLTIHHKRRIAKILYKRITKNYYGTLLRIKSDIMLQSIFSTYSVHVKARKDQSLTDSVVQCHPHTLNGSQLYLQLYTLSGTPSNLPDRSSIYAIKQKR